MRVQVSKISKHAKRFLFKISSATEFFLENKAMKLDFTLLFHMDVQALDIPTYIHTSLQGGILFAGSKLQKKHLTSILC